jgi:toxin FitB
MIVDSNIIIYAGEPVNEKLRDYLEDEAPAISVVTPIEVLGFPRITDDERRRLQTIIQTMELLPLDEAVLDGAIRLRQQRRIGLADSIIAATALVHQQNLVTHNTQDFRWIEGLTLHDPIEET